MNDERFFNLAMKVTSRQLSEAERAELDALIATKPELRVEFARLQEDVRITKEALPLVDATQAATGELPGYARGRLQTKVRQTLGGPAAAKEPGRGLAGRWRWVLGLSAATAVVLLVAWPTFRPLNTPVIQLAMLDATGGTRGTETNDLALLQATWKESPVRSFSSVTELEAWAKAGPIDNRRRTAIIIYEPSAAEVRVSGHSKGKAFQKTFPLEKDLATTLQQVNAFLLEHGF